jgi:hypothetical protein
MRIILVAIPLSGPGCPIAADVNGDGVVRADVISPVLPFSTGSIGELADE